MVAMLSHGTLLLLLVTVGLTLAAVDYPTQNQRRGTAEPPEWGRHHRGGRNQRHHGRARGRHGQRPWSQSTPSGAVGDSR